MGQMLFSSVEKLVQSLDKFLLFTLILLTDEYYYLEHKDTVNEIKLIYQVTDIQAKKKKKKKKKKKIKNNIFLRQIAYMNKPDIRQEICTTTLGPLVFTRKGSQIFIFIDLSEEVEPILNHVLQGILNSFSHALME